MTEAFFEFFLRLEPWIRTYSYALAGFFGAGLLVMATVSALAVRRLGTAARGIAKLPSLSAIDGVNGAAEKTYNDLLGLVDALPDRGGEWWVAVHPTIEGYARKGAGKRASLGYFVTERIDESVGASSGDGWTSFVHAVPGVLTSMGLLGTFIALLIGLQGLQPHADGTYDLSGLISNLSGKFVTSIVALSLSVIFVLIELGARAAVANARLGLIQALSRVLPFLSQTHLLLDMRFESARQSATLASIRREAKQQTEAISGLGRSSAEQVNLLSGLTASASGQAASLTEIKEIGDRTATQIERFNTELAVSIGTAMDARIVPALQSLLESTEKLHTIQAGLGEELLKEVGAKISGAVSGAAGEEMKAVSLAIKEAATTLQSATDAMKEGQDKLVTATGAIIDQINKVFGDNSKRLQEETVAAVSDVVKQIGSAAGGFSETIGGAGTNVAAALLTTSANLQTVVVRCEQIVAKTDATVKQFDGLVTGMSGATKDIVDAHAALRVTAQPIQAVAERTATLISSLDRQVTTIGEAAKSLQATSMQVREVQATLEASWRGYETRFAAVDSALANSLTQIRSGFDQYAEKISALNAGLDEHLGKALSDLSGVAAELHEALEEMQSGRK